MKDLAKRARNDAKMIAKGMSIAEIAHIFDLTEEEVHKRVKDE